MSLPKILSFIKSKACPNGIASLNVAGKLEQMPTSGDIGAISTTEKGVANGIATLDINGKLIQPPTSVSYTHLDVYKRQILMRPMNWGTK